MPSQTPDEDLPEEDSLSEHPAGEPSDPQDEATIHAAESELDEDAEDLAEDELGEERDEDDSEFEEEEDAEDEEEEEDDDEPQDLEAQLRAATGSDDEEEQEDGDELSLEQLSASYANVLQVAQPSTDEAPPEEDDSEDEGDLDNDSCPTTPTAIIEALLFVGRSDSGEIAGKEIASLMRGVDEAEVDRCVDELNAIYQQNDHAIRIARVGAGYKVVLADEMNFVRDRFYGRVRDIKLNQAAIDCLALVAYQPGIGRKQLDEQRGQPSGGVLNQLVRRELLEVRREGKGKTAETHYYPTEKMLNLAGLATLEDLPQVEDLD